MPRKKNEPTNWFELLGMDREGLWQVYQVWANELERRLRSAAAAEAEIATRLYTTAASAKRYRTEMPKGEFLLVLCHRIEKAQMMENSKDLDEPWLDASSLEILNAVRVQLVREVRSLEAQLDAQAQSLRQEQQEAAERAAALGAQVRAAQQNTQHWMDKVQELEAALAAIPDWGLARNHLFILDQAFRRKGLIAPEGWESPALLRLIIAWQLAKQRGHTAAAKQALQDVQRQRRQERVVYLWTWPIRTLLEIVLAEHDDDQGPPK